MGGITIAQLDNAALRALITEQLNSLQQIVGRYGNTDLFGQPLEEDAPRGLPEAVELQVTRPAPMAPSTFNGQGKPAQSVGGLKKAAGARAVNALRRAKDTARPL